ncbi:retroviral-like aspartic protease family protein [Nitrospirillum sp. BR 11163]|uniref:retroviral-like aspartic protease family protein n=1 Tax=Nitrospirillum sp. BR 11163 TaxID=3104323 RepID=UPI002B001458|nr:retroviral-like aspartic protease family protein [Nitrospirillum sp. BR 11163]MEA1674200.1 retroviral-like aspartic protease family protein [Nitrospirillum sp. BR 11163]
MTLGMWARGTAGVPVPMGWWRIAAGVVAVVLGIGFAGPHAGAAETECKLVRTGTLNLVLDGNMPLLDTAVNGQKAYLMMDTGAAVSTITKPAADRLKLRHHWIPDVYMEGVGGRVTVDEARLDELKLGDGAAHNLDFPVFGNHDLTDNPDIIGVLGENVLSKFDLDIDVAHNRLGLFHPVDCGNTALAYWGDPYEEAEIGRSSQLNPKIWLTVKLNGEEVRAILDTGAYTSILTTRAAKWAGLTPESPGVVHVGATTGIGDNKVEDYIGTFDTFELGGEQIKHVRLRFGELFDSRGF